MSTDGDLSPVILRRERGWGILSVVTDNTRLTVETVFIDMDGTLVDLPPDFSRPAYLANRLAQLGHAVDPDRMEAAHAEAKRWWAEHTGDDYTRRTREAGVAANSVLLDHLDLDRGRDVARLAEELERHWERVPYEGGETLYPESQQALDMLRAQGITLAVLSHRSTPLIQNSLAAHGLLDYFSFFVSPQASGAAQGKLDQRMWNYALSKARTTPKRAAHIGDIYEDDVVGAHAAGVLPVLIDRNYAYPEADCLRAATLHEAAQLILRPRP